VEHDFPGIGQREMLLNARRVVGGTDLKPRILLAMEDVTGRPGLEQFTEKENSQKGDGR
jgi:chemotaxis protein methyltransferase CheR